jgi:hypothetical protein
MSDYHEPVWDCSSYLHIQQISFNIKISSKLLFVSIFFCTNNEVFGNEVEKHLTKMPLVGKEKWFFEEN